MSNKFAATDTSNRFGAVDAFNNILNHSIGLDSEDVDQVKKALQEHREMLISDEAMNFVTKSGIEKCKDTECKLELLDFVLKNFDNLRIVNVQGQHYITDGMSFIHSHNVAINKEQYEKFSKILPVHNISFD